MSAQNISRKTLYNTETGEAQSFHLVDARECLARGGWSETPVKAKAASRGGDASTDANASEHVSPKSEPAAKASGK